MIVLLALVHGWGSYANAASSSHDPAYWSGPGEAALEARGSGHGHSHDELVAEIGDPERQGGHNSADHSHDKPSLPRSGAQAAIVAAGDWSPVDQVPLHPAPCFAFDRPPKCFPLH